MKAVFVTRILLYGAAVVLPAYHPAVAVAYDSVSRWAWFALVPVGMFAAFLGRPPRFRYVHGFLAAALVVFLSAFFVTGLNRSALLFVVAAGAGFVSTHLVFSLAERGRGIAVLETIALCTVYYKLLSFARASEDTFRESSQWTVIVLTAGCAAFLVHTMVLYLAAFPDRAGHSTSVVSPTTGKGRKRRELVVFALIGVPVLLFTALLLPPNFVKNRIPLNDLNVEPPPKPKELRDDLSGSPDKRGPGGTKEEEHKRNGLPLGEREEKFPSELQQLGERGSESDTSVRERRADEQRGGKGQQARKDRGGSGNEREKGQGGKSKSLKNKLKGMPSRNWTKETEPGGESGNQMAVMVVASPVDPVYASEAYWGDMDPVKGFQISRADKLNDLARLRLLEKWQDPHPSDAARQPIEIFYMSTLADRTVAYRPFVVEPTIMDMRYHPFNLSYKSVSRMSFTGPEHWKEIPGLSAQERIDYAGYLAVNLNAGDAAFWKERAGKIIEGKAGYFARVAALLQSFGRYKYAMGFDEDTSVKKLTTFLRSGKTGDCTEFSHTMALLARVSGIPSRVVTGYLASRDLQTPAHRRGLDNLRARIPPLQKYRIEQLYLVTTAHHHAWVQLYMPGYGWIDFETTSYAIPPDPAMDPNSMDVVIPLIEEQNAPPEFEFVFPYRLVLKILGVLALVFAVALYSFRYGREAWLALVSRGSSERAISSLMQLMLMRLAADGHPLKAPYETPLEFSRRYPTIRPVAGIYNLLRFQQNFPAGEKEEALAEYKKTAAQIAGRRKPGFFNAVRRFMSLRSLYY